MLLESLTIPLISSILACLALEAWTHESRGGAVEINRNLQKFWGPLWNYPTLFTFLTTLSRWLILNKCVFILISEVINKEFFISAGKEFPRGWDIRGVYSSIIRLKCWGIIFPLWGRILSFEQKKKLKKWARKKKRKFKWNEKKKVKKSKKEKIEINR